MSDINISEVAILRFHSNSQQAVCTNFVSLPAAALFSSREAPSRVKAPGIKCIKGAFVDKKGSAGKRRGEE